jgi:hypothetical protein
MVGSFGAWCDEKSIARAADKYIGEIRYVGTPGQLNPLFAREASHEKFREQGQKNGEDETKAIRVRVASVTWKAPVQG